MSSTLTDAELARLEELAEKATPRPWAEMNRGLYPMVYGPNGERVCRSVDSKNDTIYIAAACNAVPSLVAEVRRLRAENEASSRIRIRMGMDLAGASAVLGEAIADFEGEEAKLQAENAALREKGEALEWLVECMDNYEWCCNRSGWFITHGVHHEAKATLEAAREAIK